MDSREEAAQPAHELRRLHGKRLRCRLVVFLLQNKLSFVSVSRADSGEHIDVGGVKKNVHDAYTSTIVSKPP
jgi:hypothetical protein